MIRLRTLAESTIEVGTHHIGPESPHLFGLLVYLCFERGRSVSRARIRELLWPEMPTPQASHSLRQLLYRARQIGASIHATPSHIRLESEVVADFGLKLLDTKQPCIAPSEERIGSFLDGYAPGFSKPFAAWIDDQRAVVHARLRVTLVARLAIARAKGDWNAVGRCARALMAIDPLNEEATLSLAEATALSGNKVEAVALLDKYLEELGGQRDQRLLLPTTLLRRRIAEQLADSMRRHREGAFVGRADSMALLHQAVQNTNAGRGETIVIHGGAGMGKTRLVEEFIRGAHLLGTRIERLTCQPLDRLRPMSVFSGLAQRLLELPGALGCSPASYSLLRRFCPLHSPTDAISAEAANADGLAANIRHALYDVLDAISSERCLVIVIEDFHWGDDRSVELLAEMATWARDRRLAFVLTSRTHEVGLGSQMKHHALPPLDSKAIHDLAISLLPSTTEFSPDVSDLWVRYSGGNPLYVRELVAHWDLTGDANSIPPSLSQLLTQRVSGLSDTATLALRAIAVLGRNSSTGRILAVLQCPNHLLVSALDELEGQGLVRGTGDFILCSHEMVARASLGAMSPLALRTLHRLSALTLEKESRPFSAAHILWDCTRHWECAGDPERGLDLTIECSKQLLELGLPHEAATLLTSARPLASKADALGRLLGALAQAYHRGGRWHELYDILLERRAIAPTLRAPHDELELLMVEAAWRRHDRDHTRLLHQATECAHAKDSSTSHRLRAASQGIRMAAESCNRELAIQLYNAAIALPPDPSLDPTLRLEIETVYHTSFGDLDRGAAAAGDLIASCRATGIHAEIAKALRFASFPYRIIGRLDEAESVLLESLELAKSHQLGTAITQSSYRLGVHYLAIGQPVQALHWCAEVTALQPQQEDSFGRSYLALLAFQAHLALGDSESARATYAAIGELQVLDGLTRVASEFVAAGIRLQLEISGADVGRTALAKLLRLHRRTRGMGADDFAAGTLFRSFAAIGMRPRALELFDEYVTTHRRDRIPFEPDLAAFADGLQFNDSLSAQSVC